MNDISEGRVVELINATNEQRQALARVVSAIKSARGLKFIDIYDRAVGSMRGYSDEDEKNLGKGIIAKWKAALLFRWIVENHLPLGCDEAPELFDPSLLTKWRDFIRMHGSYNKLHIQNLGRLGLTERSSGQPIADDPIRLGDAFLFNLNCKIDGVLLALEVHEGKTYPMALHPDHVSVLTQIKAGSCTLPLKADGTPDPLSETVDKGLRSYIFIVAAFDILKQCCGGLAEGHAIGLDTLDNIALAFKNVNQSLFEVHRLNVIFTD